MTTDAGRQRDPDRDSIEAEVAAEMERAFPPLTHEQMEAAIEAQSVEQLLVPQYHPSPTGRLFHKSGAIFRGIRGPFGSGKSVACVEEIVMCAFEQEPSADKVRRSRWAAVRNTYGELTTTTIKTWQEWVPEELCPFRWDKPITARMIIRIPDADGVWRGDLIDLQVIFISLDRPQDVRKLKSLDLTGVWFNEASELEKAVIDMGSARIGRYPPKFAGGPSRPCMIADTNSNIDEDHWWYQLAEVVRPDGYAFFDQPPALIEFKRRTGEVRYLINPDAENIDNQPKGGNYWLDMVQGKKRDWIACFILNHYRRTHDGKPVYEDEFTREWNVSKTPLVFNKGLPLYIGIDGGLTPAAAFLQLDYNGRLLVLAEVVSLRAGMKQLLYHGVMPLMHSRFRGASEVIVRYDPSIETADASDIESSPAQAIQKAFRDAGPAVTNDWDPRRDSLSEWLNRTTAGGPSLIVDPSCQYIIRGMAGGYRYARVQVHAVSDSEIRYQDKPIKNIWSHVIEAGQYAAMEILSQQGDGLRRNGSRSHGRRAARPVEGMPVTAANSR